MRPIGITMGCPVGIGPEIILRYFSAAEQNTHKQPVIVIGDRDVLEFQAGHLNIDIQCISWSPGKPLPHNGVPVYNVGHLNPASLRWGTPTQETGRAMVSYIEESVHLHRQKFIDAVVTCPISKSALRLAGNTFPGHTEMYAHLIGENQFTMMMAGEKLRVTLVTIHCGFSKILQNITVEKVFDRILLTHESLRKDFALPSPKIAIAGLNPHGGEGGLFGTEEQHIIQPAIMKAQAAGMNVTGPFPPDTVFLSASKGDFDAVVSMYHDQGLIPFKLLHFEDGVNLTIGLSLIRASVDHGTAYDIAGQGKARESSLAAAVRLAAEIAINRKNI